MEREKGFEPSTPGLGSRCSTTELLPHQRHYTLLKLNLTEFLIEVLDIIGHICLGVGVMCWEKYSI